MCKIAICDDDKEYREKIKTVIKTEGILSSNEIRFYEYESGKELLEDADILHDLIFMDMRMPGLDGNKTVLKLREYNEAAILVFCSGCFEPTPDSINVGQPFRYIMKDLHDRSLKKEIPMILLKVKLCCGDSSVTVTSAGRIMRIHTEDILYICLAKRGCTIYIARQGKIEEMHCKESLSDLYECLAGRGFEYAHNSYIVNLAKVEGLEKNVALLSFGIQLKCFEVEKRTVCRRTDNISWGKERHGMIIRDYLICLLQMYLLEDLEKNILPYRRERFWEKFLVYCIAALAMFGTNRLESSILNMVMIPVIYMIASMVVFRGNIWKKLVTVCCYYVLAIIPEFLFAALTNAYGVTGASEGFRTETEKTLALLLMSTMTFLFIKCINQVTRKRDYLTIENKTFTVLLMLPTATIVMLGCMFYSHTSFEGMNRVMVPVGASLLLMTNIFIFTVFDRFVEKSEEVKKMDRLYQKSRAEIANLQYMNKVNEDNRAFLHDINKFICTVAGLIEEGENQEVKDIMEHLGVRIQNLQKSVYCEHPILNSILCERKFLAESKDISYRITLGNDLRLDFLEELDLISIVGNLLDNALEAAEKTEDGRYVECRMYMGNAGHFLVMEFCNGYVVPLLKDKDRYISTKRDADSHGIGLHTVGKLVKKYAGIMRVEAGEREFSVKLIFTIK